MLLRSVYPYEYVPLLPECQAVLKVLEFFGADLFQGL